MKIDFRFPLDVLTSDELAFVSTQVRFATRFHDAPLAGVRIELTPEDEVRRARVPAIEQAGSTVVTEREAETALEAICEAVCVLDRALHSASMNRANFAQQDWAA